MPISNLFKNCSYYYGFAAYVVGGGGLAAHAPAYGAPCRVWARLLPAPPPAPDRALCGCGRASPRRNVTPVQAYFVNHPMYTAPNETLSIVCFALAILCQYTNYM